MIGGPLHLDREDFPIIDPDLWPFPFELEPLSKLSLAKYVLAETSTEGVLESLGLKDEIDAIKRTLNVEGDVTVHRVGLIYDKVNQLFSANPMPQGPDVSPYTDQNPSIATIDIQEGTEKYQVTPAAWGLGYRDLLIKTAHDRSSGQNAIKMVSEQEKELRRLTWIAPTSENSQDLPRVSRRQFLETVPQCCHQSDDEPRHP